MTIRTALLEARYLWGDREAVRRADQAASPQKFVTGDGRDFVEAKLAERDQRHQRMGDSRYVVEPNVKEGKGGLRDLHTLFWIAKYLYRVDEPGRAGRQGRADRRTRRATSSAPSASSRPCAATSTISPAAPTTA